VLEARKMRAGELPRDSVELIFGNLIREPYGLDGQQFAANNVREGARPTIETVSF
jgi:hypothetical protein